MDSQRSFKTVESEWERGLERLERRPVPVHVFHRPMPHDRLVDMMMLILARCEKLQFAKALVRGLVEPGPAVVGEVHDDHAGAQGIVWACGELGIDVLTRSHGDPRRICELYAGAVPLVLIRHDGIFVRTGVDAKGRHIGANILTSRVALPVAIEQLDQAEEA